MAEEVVGMVRMTLVQRRSGYWAVQRVAAIEDCLILRKAG